MEPCHKEEKTDQQAMTEEEQHPLPVREADLRESVSEARWNLNQLLLLREEYEKTYRMEVFQYEEAELRQVLKKAKKQLSEWRNRPPPLQSLPEQIQKENLPENVQLESEQEALLMNLLANQSLSGSGRSGSPSREPIGNQSQEKAGVSLKKWLEENNLDILVDPNSLVPSRPTQRVKDGDLLLIGQEETPGIPSPERAEDPMSLLQ